MSTDSLARTITGTVGGLVGISGAKFNAKIHAFRLNIVQSVADVSGFGDGGNSYNITGRNQWAASLQGVVTTGASGTAGIANLTGTSSFLGSVTLGADTNRTYSGSCRVNNISVNANYLGRGDAPISFTITGYGPLSES